MTDAAAPFQSMDGRGQAVHNLVYNPTSGKWELEQQGVIESVSSNLYLAVDDIEQYILDQLDQYKFSGWAVSGTAVYLGYEDKDGNYYVSYFETSTGVITYSKGTGGIVSPGAYSGLSYASFASTF